MASSSDPRLAVGFVAVSKAAVLRLASNYGVKFIGGKVVGGKLLLASLSATAAATAAASAAGAFMWLGSRFTKVGEWLHPEAATLSTSAPRSGATAVGSGSLGSSAARQRLPPLVAMGLLGGTGAAIALGLLRHRHRLGGPSTSRRRRGSDMRGLAG